MFTFNLIHSIDKKKITNSDIPLINGALLSTVTVFFKVVPFLIESSNKPLPSFDSDLLLANDGIGAAGGGGGGGARDIAQPTNERFFFNELFFIKAGIVIV